MAKIVIGQRTESPSSPMGCWVAAPGGNAETGAGRMILDSELDHLKLWDSGSIVVDGIWRDPDTGLWEYDPVTINFPSLPYIPLAFVNVARATGHGSDNIATSYPPGTNFNSSGFPYLNSNSYENVTVEVNTNNLQIGRYWTGNAIILWDLWEISQARISWFVFANRRDQLPPGPLSNPERILIEGGNNPRFRVSRPGYSVNSSDDSHFLVREDRPTLRPVLTGSVSVSQNNSQSVSLPGFSLPPFVVLKSNDNDCPGRDNYFASVNKAGTLLTIHNVLGGTRTISYAVYHPNP